MKNITPNMVDALPVSASKIYNPKNYLFICISLIVVIACALALGLAGLDTSGAVYYLVAFVGAIGLAVLLYYAIGGEKVYRTADGKMLKEKELYYANGSARALYEALSKSDTAELAKLMPIAEGGVRLDLLYDPDLQFGVAQVNAYEPYQYYAYEQVVKLDAATLKAVLK